MVDIALGADGDIRHSNLLVTGDDLTLQRVRCRLRLFLGEYLADAAQGLDYFAWAQEKPANVSGVVLRVRAEIEGCHGIARVDTLTGALNVTTRTLSLTGKGILASGAGFSIDLAPPAPGVNASVVLGLFPR